MAAKYGYAETPAILRKSDGCPEPGCEKLSRNLPDLDDYPARRIAGNEDWCDLFGTPLHFGCRAGGRADAWGVKPRANPLGARLNATFSSDSGHVDVPDMTPVLGRATPARAGG